MVFSLWMLALALAIAACGAQPVATTTSDVANSQPTASNTPGAAPTSTAGTPVQSGFPPGVGDLAPDFTLPVATGGEVTLSQFRGEQSVVLVFYRAFW